MAQRNSKFNINNSLQKLIRHLNLSIEEAKALFEAMLGGEVSFELARSFLVLLREKGESPGEIFSAALVLRDKSKSCEANFPYLVDNCGTGGDGKFSFNISTLSAFVAAAAGARVAKHGNRSISSKAGSSDLLESLGVNIMANAKRMIYALREIGIAYFHAPLYHPVLKKLHALRKRIGGRTVFNFLGPLLNPVRVRYQVIGVPHRQFLPVVAKALQLLGTKRAFVVCGENGMDEVTPYGITRCLEVQGGRMRPFVIAAQKIGFRRSQEKELRGGSLARNRSIAVGLLKGEILDAKKDAVILNAALTLLACGKAKSLAEGVELSRFSLESGQAFRTLERFIMITNR